MAPPSKKARIGHEDPDSDVEMASGSDMEEINEPKPTADSRKKQRAKKVHNTEDPSARCTVFVRGLPYTTTQESLSAHFSFIAPLKHAAIVMDAASKKSRGFGFVTFTEPDDAQKAVKEYNNTVFEGRQMKCEIATPRHREAETAEDGTSVVPKLPREPGKDEKKRSPRLIVRNLPWSVKKPEQLSVIFSKFGKVREVIIPRKDNSKSPSAPMSGFGFVTMRNRKHAEKAMEEINGMEIDGRTVAVDWAVEKGKYTETAADGGETGDEAEADTEVKEEDEDMDMEGLDEFKDEDENSDTGSVSDADSEQGALDEEAEDSEDEDEERDAERPPPKNSSTIFIRNLPFSTEDQNLEEHFALHFGPVRYARVVLDPATERPRGTGFVAFFNEEDCDACVSSAPRNTIQTINTSGKGGKKNSILQSESLDASGKYTIDSRVLSISRAVSREEASRLTVANTNLRDKLTGDKRRLYLLTEGTIPSNHPMYQTLSNTEISLREASLKQRKSFIEKNPSLHLSLTRLSIRNIPRNITEKDLKQLARKAVVEFASEVKKASRQPLSKEENARGGHEAREEEKRRKAQGKGVVRQAKIVREGNGAGRSKGYGFIEYVGHRWALMGLRWLNGREVANFSFTAELPAKGKAEKNGKKAKKSRKEEVRTGEDAQLAVEDRKRRLIVEFALENVQVTARRHENEEKARARARNGAAPVAGPTHTGPTFNVSNGNPEFKSKYTRGNKADAKFAKKRKHEQAVLTERASKKSKLEGGTAEGSGPGGAMTEDDKVAKAARIIARKRQLRRAKSKGRKGI